MTEEISITQVSVPAVDSFQLAGTIFQPKRITDHQGNPTLVLLPSATGVKRGFYTPFASYLAANNCVVLTFDYRGIGESRPKSLKGFKSNLTDWGVKDMTGALVWLHKNYAKSPNDKIVIVGHSVGGHVVGMVGNKDLIERLMTVTSQSAYWKYGKGGTLSNYKWYLFWLLVVPVLTWWFGYFPAKRIGMFDDIPGNAMLEWREWVFHPDYMCGKATTKAQYQQVNFPILSYSFSDDHFASYNSIKQFHRLYPNHLVELRHVKPADIGVKSIGHMGFFRSQTKDLWKESLEFIKKGTMPPGTAKL